MFKKITALTLLLCYSVLWSGVAQAVVLEMTRGDHAVHVSAEFGKQQIILHAGADEHDHKHAAEEHSVHFDTDNYDHPDHSLPDLQHEDSVSVASMADDNGNSEKVQFDVGAFHDSTFATSPNFTIVQFPQPPPFQYLAATITLRRTLVIQV